MAQLPKRTLGKSLEVSCMGLGCMGMTAFYSGSNPVPKEECVATIRRAIERGSTFLDTAELYNVGLTQDNNEQLIGAPFAGQAAPARCRLHDRQLACPQAWLLASHLLSEIDPC
jgi:aryl-alcohol dehydrogenase-like predicted oxidoreductase